MNLTELAFKVDSSQLLEAKQALQGVAGALTDVAKAEEGRNNTASKSRVKEQAKDAEKLTEAESKVTKALEHQNKMLKYTEAGYTKVQARQLALAESAGAGASELAVLGQALVKVDVAAKSNNKTTEESVKVQKEHTSVTQKQKDVLDFMSQGFSKGQASVLAHAKALKEDTEALGEVLQAQRRLTGAEPFDKSMSGILAMQNEYRQLVEVIRQVNKETGLTAQQAENLARDKQRLFESWKNSADGAEGSVFSVRSAMRELEQQYVASANQVNRLVQEEKKHQQAARETAQAIKYLATEDEKMQAALLDTNAALDKASTDKLVKYEQALRKSGLASDVQVQKLRAYRAELNKVQQQEQQRAEQHLARALSPQITDIGVSLWSGQNPLTVLIQQGGQVVDLFRLSGVEANKMGQAMTDAFMGMIPSIAAVGKGVAELAGNLLMMPVNALTTAVLAVPPIGAAVENVGAKLNASAAAGNAFAQAMLYVGAASKALIATGVGAVIAAAAALAVGWYKATKEQDEFVKALALSHNSLGITSRQAFELSASLGEMTGSASKTIGVMTEMAKSGKFTADHIEMITKSAVDLKTWGGVAISDTVKEFEKFAEKPVESLIELAKKTGLVSPEVIRLTMDLVEQGKKADAVKVSMQALADTQKSAVHNMKQDYSAFASFVIGLGNTISNFFSNTFKNIWYAADPKKHAEQQVKALENQINALSKRQGSYAGLSKEEADAYLEEWKDDLKRLKRQADAEWMRNSFTQGIVEANKAQAEALDVVTKEAEKHKTALDGLNERLNKQKQIAGNLALTEETRSAAKKNQLALEKQIAEEIEKQAKKDNKGLAKEQNALNTAMEQYRSIMGVAEGFTSSYYKQMDQLALVLQKGRINQEQYNDAVAKLQEQQPYFKEQQKNLEILVDLEEKYLGITRTRSKETVKALDDLDKAKKSKPFMTDEEADNFERLRDAIIAADPYAKKLQDAFEKISLDVRASREAIADKSKDLDDQYKVAFMTTKEAKNYTREQERQKALNKANLDYAKRRLDIERQLSNDPAKLSTALAEAEREFQENLALINKEYASKYAQDFATEFNKVKGDITDVIATALFEGGKEGRKKLQDILKQRFRIQVTAVIDNIVGQGLQMLIGGGSSAAGGVSGGNVSQPGNGVGGQLLNSMTGGAGVGGLIAGVGGMLNIGGLTALGSGMAAGGSLGLTAGLSQGMSMLGAGAGSTAAGLGTMLGAAMPYLAGALAVASLLKGAFSGEHRTGSQYGIAYDGTVVNNRRGQTYTNTGQNYRNPNATGAALETGRAYWLEGADPSDADSGIAKAIEITASGIDGLFEMLGSTARLSGFWAGFETSGKGRGGVMSGGMLADGTKFGESGEGDNYAGTLYEKFSSTSPDFEQALKDFELDLKQVTLQALQSADDLPSSIAKMLEGVETELLSGEAVDALLVKIQSIAVGAVNLSTALELMDLNKPTGNIIDFTAALSEFNGGLENSMTLLKGFYESFYSEEERIKAAAEQMKKALSMLDLSIDPMLGEEAKKQYRDAVNAALKAGDAELYASLLNLSGAFAEIADYAADAAKKAANEILEVQEKLKDLAWKNFEAAINRTTEALEAQIRTAQEAVNAHKNLANIFKNAVRELRNTIEETLHMQAGQGMQYIDNALKVVRSGGNITQFTDFAEAISAVRTGFDSTIYASQFEQERDALALANKLEVLGDLNDVQLTVEEKQLKVLNSQLDYYKNMYNQAKLLVDGVNNLIDVTLTPEKAYELLMRLLKGETEGAGGDTGKPVTGGGFVAGPGSSGPTAPQGTIGADGRYYRENTTLSWYTGTSNYSAVSDAEQKQLEALAGSLSGFSGSGNVQEALLAAQASGASLSDVATVSNVSYLDLLEVAKNLGIPAFDVGTNYVPEDMFAVVHKGERIIPEADNRRLMQAMAQPVARNNDTALLNELKVTNSKLAAVQSELSMLKQAAATTAVNTGRTYRKLDDVTQGSDSLRITPAD